MELSRKKQLFVTLAVFAVIIFIMVGVIMFGKKTANTKTAATTSEPATTLADTTTSQTATNATGTSETSSYKDGTYSAAGSYYTPESNETINVSLTIKDGVITDATANGSVHARESQMYQAAFLDNYKPLVVGKKLDQVALSRVSGSSLTSQGFNDALAQIKQQALS